MLKQRLDVVMVAQGLVESREKAKALIMAGQVKVDGRIQDKAGTNITEKSKIELIGSPMPYVSRGGLKLEKAIKFFSLNLFDKVVADIGASTGGFTDCALQSGAKKVYAIDVGYGQLDWKLRTDLRVVSMERTNARYLQTSDLGEPVDFISIDVAFISLEKILPTVYDLLNSEGEVIALIKPQFEAGKENVGKKGVVRDPEIHKDVISKILSMAQSLNFLIKGLTYSPVKGPEGNIEYLLWLSKSQITLSENPAIDLNLIIDEAHSLLEKG